MAASAFRDTGAEMFVIVNSSDFHADLLLQNALEQEANNIVDDDLFSLRDLSPLTTAPTSPIHSPSTITDDTIAASNRHYFDPGQIDRALEQLREELFSFEGLSPPPSSNSSKNPSLSPSPIPTPSAAAPHALPNVDPSPIQVPQRKRKKRTEKDKAQSHTNRKKKRLLKKLANFSTPTREDVIDKHVKYDAAIPASNDAKQAPTTKDSYIARRLQFDHHKQYSLNDLIGPGSMFGLRLVHWDGCAPLPIVDLEGRVIGILAGRPEGRDWDDAMKEAIALLQEAANSTNTAPEVHRRGEFTSLRCGISHGGGQQQPGNLCNTKTNETVLEKLNKSAPFRRISGFTSSVFATWAPKLYAYYQETYQALVQRYPALIRASPDSVFCARTYNLGPQTVCFVHTDFANLPFGWCAITALGDYDASKGGHLVLWDCGLVVEFPSGSSALIPSAIVAHSNATIGPNETRYSFTQYTAGGIFRWVEHGFKKKNDYLSELDDEALEMWNARQDRRWEWGLSLFRRVSEFRVK